jgi:hypothetical protein
MGWTLTVAGAGGGPINSLVLPIDALEGRLPPLPRGGIFGDGCCGEQVQVSSHLALLAPYSHITI